LRSRQRKERRKVCRIPRRAAREKKKGMFQLAGEKRKKGRGSIGERKVGCSPSEKEKGGGNVNPRPPPQQKRGKTLKQYPLIPREGEKKRDQERLHL